MIWTFNNKNLEFAGIPKIMGIVNITPDSFFDGGQFISTEKAVEHALKLIAEGAGLLDLGAESSRPGADPVSAGEELDRLIPVLQGIRKESNVIISIDTYKTEVALEALNNEADMINDISGAASSNMLDIILAKQVPVILMHMKGKPKNMQKTITYENVLEEVTEFLCAQVKKAKSIGINHIIVDPGIGFGKHLANNLTLMANIDLIRKSCGTPLLLGASRKSFIEHLLHRKKDERLPGSLAVAAWSFIQHVDIIRVHDVKETADVITVMSELQDKRYNKDLD